MIETWLLHPFDQTVGTLLLVPWDTWYTEESKMRGLTLYILMTSASNLEADVPLELLLVANNIVVSLMRAGNHFLQMSPTNLHTSGRATLYLLALTKKREWTSSCW